MNSFFDTLYDKAKDFAGTASRKTGEYVEISKYKYEYVKINSKIRKLYEQLGSSVYSMVKGGYDNQSLIDGLVEEIDEMLMRLDAINEKIAELKTIVNCPICGGKNAKENYYCCKCGSRIRNEYTSDKSYDAYDGEDLDPEAAEEV